MAHQSGGLPVPHVAYGWRAGLARGLRRIANRLVAPAAPPARFPVAVPNLPLAVQQERARSVLAEASATMSGLMDEPPTMPSQPAVVEHLPGEAIELRQALRAYTDRLERLLARSDEERDELREHVRRLGDEVQSLRAEVAGLRAALATPETVPATLPGAEDNSATTTGAPLRPSEGYQGPIGESVTRTESERVDEEAMTAVGEATSPSAPVAESAPGPEAPRATAVSDKRVAEAGAPTATPRQPDPAEDEARLGGRVFPAGTIGVVVTLSPVESFAGLTGIQSRLAAEPGVEHVELQQFEGGVARLHLNFRHAIEWPRLRAGVARAAGLDALDLRCTLDGPIVRVRLLRAVAAPASAHA